MSKLLLIFKINDINFINISFKIAKFHLKMARHKNLMINRNSKKYSESNRNVGARPGGGRPCPQMLQ